jgi:hypothetical protein
MYLRFSRKLKQTKVFSLVLKVLRVGLFYMYSVPRWTGCRLLALPT